MKSFFCALMVVACLFATHADDDWRTTVGKVKDLSGDTGIAGFVQRSAPAYITGDFAETDRPEKKPLAANRNGYYDKNCEWHGGYFDDVGAFVKGHKVETLFGMPYGVGQLIMIPVCLVLMYLAIVKGFEPLLLLPIGFGGLLANCPLSGITLPAMMHDGVISFLASGVPVMQGGIVEPGGFLHYFFKFGIDSGVFPIMIFMGVGAMTDFGPLIAKIMNVFSSKENRVNPLIGLAGVSAVPMAARVSNKVALSGDPTNYVLMQAMGPNVSGVIGSAVVAGVLYTLCR